MQGLLLLGGGLLLLVAAVRLPFTLSFPAIFCSITAALGAPAPLSLCPVLRQTEQRERTDNPNPKP